MGPFSQCGTMYCRGGSLGAAQKRCSGLHCAGSCCNRCPNAGSIDDATGCNDRHIGRTNQTMHQRQRVELTCQILPQKHPTMTTSLKSLGDDAIDPSSREMEALVHRRGSRQYQNAKAAQFRQQIRRGEPKVKAHHIRWRGLEDLQLRS